MAAASTAPRRTKTRASAARKSRRAGAGGVRWDRVGRIALLGTLGVILLLYVSPAKHWLQQSGTARAQSEELDQLKGEKRRLQHRVTTLRDPGALDREARRLGMVRQGERAYVIEKPAR